MAEPEVSPLVDLIEVFARLRRECAWKAEQTHESLVRYLLEECAEAVEAIESGDPDRVRDELGDVLLQVYLHAEIAAEAGQYDVEDVAAGLRAKMIRRNPHVFAAAGVEPPADAEAINERWQEIKAQDQPRSSLLDGVPEALSSLLRADKMLDRAERAGLPVAPAPDATDIGERLLALVAEARAAGIDADQALRAAVRRREQPLNRP